MSDIVSRRDAINLHKIRPTLSGTVIEGDNITLVRWVVEPDQSQTPIHLHEKHEQFTIVVEGSIETVVGEETLILNAGDVCRIKAGVPHGKTLPAGKAGAVLIDVFEPVREEYVALAHGTTLE